MVLFQIRLERSVVCTSRFLADGGAGACHEVHVVVWVVLLAAPYAPADEGDTAKENGSADASNYAADYLLGRRAEAGTARIAVVAVVEAR